MKSYKICCNNYTVRSRSNTIIKNRNKTKIEEYTRLLNSGLVFRINNKYKNFDFIEQLNRNYKKEYCASITDTFRDVRNVISII